MVFRSILVKTSLVVFSKYVLPIETFLLAAIQHGISVPSSWAYGLPACWVYALAQGQRIGAARSIASCSPRAALGQKFQANRGVGLAGSRRERPRARASIKFGRTIPEPI